MDRKKTSNDIVIKAMKKMSRLYNKLPPGKFNKLKSKYRNKRKDIEESIKIDIDDLERK